MLNVHVRSAAGRIEKAEDPKAAVQSGNFVWADLYAPVENADFKAEEKLIEAALDIDAPTPLERAAIEESARFYQEGGALFLTATIMGQRTEGAFVADAVTFILAKDKLVTVRTVKPRSFAIGRSRASARIENADGAPSVLMALLEGIVERIADILQETSRDATKLSAEIFVAEGARIQLPRALRTIGRSGTLISICHDSLSSLKRLIEFTAQICTHYALPEARLRALSRDVAELERRAETLQSHIAILLDAALGLVGAQQNNSVKALSLATVAFVPPTLIASIFGMNFQAMDWFKAPWGPWVAFGLMVVTPIALFAIAKARSWF